MSQTQQTQLQPSAVKVYILSAILAAYIAYLFALNLPLQLYRDNPEETLFPFFLFLPTFASVFSAVFLCLAVPVLLFSASVCVRYLGALAALAFLFWINSAFVTFGVHADEGGEQAPLWLMLVELAAWLLFVVFLISKPRIAVRCAELITALFILSLIVDLGRLFELRNAQNDSAFGRQLQTLSIDNSRNDSYQKMKVFSKQQNILHLLLDEFQSSAIADLIERDVDERGVLDGFFFFSNTASIHSYTEMALPGILSGNVYNNQRDKLPYLKESFVENPFFDSLLAAGFQMNFHIHHLYCKEPYLEYCSSTPHASTKPRALEFLDLSLLRIVPQALKGSVFAHGSGVIRPLMDWQKESTTAGLGLTVLEEFIDDMSVADIPPTYKFFHSLMTHQPLVLNANCSLANEPREVANENILEQYRCGLRQVYALLEQLERLGIYDQTMIVISSDHGGMFKEPGKMKALRDKSIWPPVYTRAQATLLIKPFKSRGKLAESQFPARLSDIPQTVASLAKLDAQLPGENAFQENWDANRPRDYFYIHWSDALGAKSRLQGFHHYIIEGPVNEASSWRVIERPD